MGGLKSLFGGGSKAQAAPRTPIEAPNTLQSKTIVRVIDAIACGPCVGLANGAKSIYYNGVPLESENGTKNVPGVTWAQRTGTPDQDWMDGFPMVETEMADGLPVRIKAGAENSITRSILDGAYNAVRVTVGVEALFEQKKDNGDTVGQRVDFMIRLRTRGQPWKEYPQTLEGKTMGPFQLGYRFPLPGPGPWDIQVTRGTADPTESSIQNYLTWGSYTAIIDAKLTYPNTGYVGQTFDAQYSGNSIPSREFDWIGWIVRVPINYDPIGRTYAGIWDGRWKMAWSDNPAWLFYQLLTSPDAAALDDSYIDAASLYPIARYCDQYVPNGFKNGDGSLIMEPRFTANFVINTKTEAYAVINSLASCFRGMTYWGAGAVQVVADMPRDPDVIVNGTNTIDGFRYAGAGGRARHSVALVSYVDAADNYNRKIEPVEDRDLIQEIGWEPASVVGFACTTQGQAHRLGRWLLYTEKAEGETVTYRCSIDHMNVTPGSIAMIADPDYAGEPTGGRLMGGHALAAHVDRPISIVAGRTYTINLTLPDGTIHKRVLNNRPGVHEILTFAQALPAVPQPEAVWALEVTNLKPRLFRIVSVQESSPLEFTVSGVLHDPTKFPQVELGLRFEPEVFSNIQNPGVVSPPGTITVSREYISTNNGWTTALRVTWEPSNDAYTRGYLFRWQKDRGEWQTAPEITGAVYTMYGETAGHFIFHVQTVNFASVVSRPSIYEVDISDTSPITLISPSGLELEGQGNNPVFNGRNPKFVWRATAIRGAYPPGQEPAAGAGYLDSIFKDYQVRVYNMNGQLIFTDETKETTYTFDFEKNARTPKGPHRQFVFEVVMRDRWGNVSKPARLEVINPAPAQPLALELTGGYGVYFVEYARPTDLDFAGTLVWHSKESGFTPDDSSIVYDGAEVFTSIKAEINTTYYVRVAAYDSFGKTGLNVSAEIVVKVVGATPVDFLPPSVPVGFKLDSRTQVQPDGSSMYELTADWEANTEDDLLQYEIAIKEEGGNEVFFTAPSPGWRIQAIAGVPYIARIRAWDTNGNFSQYSDPPVRHVVGGDEIPPMDPTGFETFADFKGVWMEWAKPPDADFYYMEVWESTTNDRGNAILIGRPTGTEFNRRNLMGGDERWFWLRAVDRSGNQSGFTPADAKDGMYAKVKRVEEWDYQELSIKKGVLGHFIIEDANIYELTADVLKAGSTLSNTIKVNGTAIGTSVGAALDPVATINKGQVQIDPGRILISGGTSLANWRSGGDTSKFDGGNIYTNSIRANSLQIGNRAMDIIGCWFELNPEKTILSWSGGTIIYEPDTPEGHGAEGIVAGNFVYPGSGIWYIVWARGWGNLRWTDNPNVFGDPNQIVICIWYGNIGFQVTMGKTIIHGDSISTRTINASKIQAFSITAEELSTGKLITQSAQIEDGRITTAHIANAKIVDAQIVSVSASRIKTGAINATWVDVGDRNDGGGFITIESRDGYRHLAFYDQAGIQRVLIGRPWASAARERDGLYVRDMNGADILSANGLGVQIAGEAQLRGNSVANIHYSPGTPDFGFWSAPSTYGIPNRCLFTLRMVDIGPSGEETVGRLWRVLINGQEKFQWVGNERFPPNIVIDVPAGVFVNVNLQLYATFADGSQSWQPFNAKRGNDPFWSVHQYAKTVWTVLELKR